MRWEISCAPYTYMVKRDVVDCHGYQTTTGKGIRTGKIYCAQEWGRGMENRILGNELSDAELEALGIEISEDETDGSFFDGIDQMIEEVFGELPHDKK